jgi:hypothetical protein
VPSTTGVLNANGVHAEKLGGVKSDVQVVIPLAVDPVSSGAPFTAMLTPLLSVSH